MARLTHDKISKARLTIGKSHDTIDDNDWFPSLRNFSGEDGAIEAYAHGLVWASFPQMPQVAEYIAFAVACQLLCADTHNHTHNHTQSHTHTHTHTHTRIYIYDDIT